MRVLHLPWNIASQISITVRALRDIGINARGLVVNNAPIQANIGIECLKMVRLRQHLPQFILSNILCWNRIHSALTWADIIHWHFDASRIPMKLALRYINSLDKPRLVEFWGTEIRIPEIAINGNPYLAKLLKDPNNNYHISYSGSRKLQEEFAHYGFECLISYHELLEYVQLDLLPLPFRTESRLIMNEFIPIFPNARKRKPVVVHAPSRQMIKGTPIVLDAIELLKKQYNFEFKLIHGVPRDKALAMVQHCDIMLDQFVLGSMGVAALEAMAMGKPVLCYIKPSVLEKLPSEFPIINANPDNLVKVLGDLLEKGYLRHQIGRRSRTYVEKYHDAHKVAKNLVKIYEDLIARKRKN
jgi:glycosyltransferase involved in cell wall biosynthesis